MLDPSANSFATTNTATHSGPPKFRGRQTCEQVNSDTSKEARQQFYVRLKGLPWECTKRQLLDFFKEKCVVEREDCNILFLPNGRASGEALVGLPTKEDQDYALNTLNQKFIETRYIDVHPSDPAEYNRIAGRVDKEHNVPISQSSFVILMRGLPFSAHEDDCLDFFKPVPCLGVRLTKDSQGRPSGQ